MLIPVASILETIIIKVIKMIGQYMGIKKYIPVVAFCSVNDFVLNNLIVVESVSLAQELEIKDSSQSVQVKIIGR